MLALFAPGRCRRARVHPCSASESRGGGPEVGSFAVASHPVVGDSDILSGIRLLNAARLHELPLPLPRSQDIATDCFGSPAARDIVVAVSHGWRSQTHPDPNGSKAEILSRLLGELGSDSSQDILVFFDFLSISQRPFREGQQPRTEAEMKAFKTALACMHKIYFLSDRVIHLDFVDEQIHGELEEYFVQAHELRGAVVEQVGDWLQIVGIRGDSQLPQDSSFDPPPGPLSTRGWALFDRVVDVEGQKLSSLQDLNDLLVEDGNAFVKCVRHPYGRINSIPSDQRGWVFLERFITAVKCAMLQKADADKVVISESPSIKRQIESYAQSLQDAVEKDKRDGDTEGHPALKKTMAFFLKELSTKQFSAASTDKLLIDANNVADVSSPDAMLVQGIMHEFVELLSQRWIAEAAHQQSRADELSGYVMDYFLLWDEFSEVHLAKIKSLSTIDPTPVIVLLALPPMLVLLVLLPPYELPTAPWNSQVLYWTFSLPIATTTCASLFAFFLCESSGVPRTLRVQMKCVAWSAAGGALVTVMQLILSASFAVFPIPLSTFVSANVLTVWVLALWSVVPAEHRSDAQARWRIFYSMLGVMGILSVFGMIFPLLNSLLFRSDSVGWQMVILSVYLLCKLAFERSGMFLAFRLGADSIPNFVFVGAMAYELNLCVSLASGFHWLPFIELILFDAAENGFHIWSLRRQREAAQTISKRDPSEASERKQMIIVATLLLREFIELTVAAVFLGEVCMLRFVQPSTNNIVCKQSEAEFLQMVLYLGLDFGVEGVIAIVTWCHLVAFGFRPLRLLRGLVAAYLPCFLPAACCIHMFFLWLQHSHAGTDLGFEFTWINHAHPTWECGLRYIASPPA